MGFEKEFRPVLHKSERLSVSNSTDSADIIGPRGAFFLETTSTGAPVVYTLGRSFSIGDELSITVKDPASSSDAPIHINTSTAADTVFVGSSDQDMILLSTVGAGISLIAQDSTHWGVVGNNGATLSTST